MAENSINVTKMCGLYVSDWHLTAVLLPYINTQINSDIEIATILEEDLTKNIEILVGKLKLKNEEKILKTNWKKTKILKYEEINKKLSETKECKELCIIVMGKYDYIENVNIIIEKWAETRREINIKVANFYDAIRDKEKLTKILKKHKKIVNTAGEKDIKEVYNAKIQEKCI